jgi:CRP-like cAMP-binding protein
MVLFRGVPAQELERLAPLLHERGSPAGATVLTAEQPGEAVYVLLRGSVKVHLLTPDGADVILAVLGPGEVVGEMSLADSLGRSASVTTLEESVFLWIDRTTFRFGIEGSPVLARNLADILSRRMRLANAPHLLSLAALNVPGRVVSQILSLSREYGEETEEGVADTHKAQPIRFGRVGGRLAGEGQPGPGLPAQARPDLHRKGGTLHRPRRKRPRPARQVGEPRRSSRSTGAVARAFGSPLFTGA